MKFYEIEKPTTAQFIEAIENNEYFTMEQLNQKQKQLNIYFEDLWNSEVGITFSNVTNTGAFPHIFPLNEMHESFEEIVGEENSRDEYERQHELELLGMFARPLIIKK